MSDNSKRQKEADKILKQIFTLQSENVEHSLREYYDQRLVQLEVKSTTALGLIGIQYRTLNGILDGQLKMVDFTNLNKIAAFLQLSLDKVVYLYIRELKKNFPDEFNDDQEQTSYLKLYFDLTVLKKAGFIDSISNLPAIQEKITSFFGIKSISDFKVPRMDIAFSAGITQPKNKLTRAFWIQTANETFKQLSNPNPYSRDLLIEYFPKIRRMSLNVDLGFINVISDLYKLGVTVIYQDYLPSLHLRGATFVCNEKPCVVITNYRNFYATIWFALIHELFHVLFDLEEIKNNRFHLSEENNEYASVMEKEEEANSFAKEYLLPSEYESELRKNMFNSDIIELKAKSIGIHYNLFYTFTAFESKTSGKLWGMAKSTNPDFSNMLKKLENSWSRTKPISDHVKYLKREIYPN